MTAYCQTDTCLRALYPPLFWRGGGGALRRLRQLPAPGRSWRTLRTVALPVLRCVQDINGRVGARPHPFDAAGQQGAARAGNGTGSFAPLRDAQGRAREPFERRDRRDARARAISPLHGGKYAVVRLGPQGKAGAGGRVGAVARAGSRSRPPARRQSQKRCAAAVQTPACSTLLRALRLRIAEKRGVPAYMIFSDATLRAHVRHDARKRPRQLLATSPAWARPNCAPMAMIFCSAIAQWKRKYRSSGQRRERGNRPDPSENAGAISASWAQVFECYADRAASLSASARCVLPSLSIAAILRQR